MANKKYKRSWRNYLLDPNYQLRFTLTMMGVALILIVGLGWWVSEKATRATEVALNQIDGIPCNEGLTNEKKESPVLVPALDKSAEEKRIEKTVVLDAEVLENELEIVDREIEEEGVDDESQTEIKVEILETDFKLELEDPVVMTQYSLQEIEDSNKKQAKCLADVVTRKEGVLGRKKLITTLMVISAFLLMIVLGVYGIKTTHRVAGPLFKVGLYLGKLEKGIYSEVYNLRKGDQLVEFYDHFKAAHAGLKKMQEEDRDRLQDAIALAKESEFETNTAGKQLVAKMEKMLQEVEESLGG